MDLHTLRASNAELDARAFALQDLAAERAAHIAAEQEPALRGKNKDNPAISRVLVTGSRGLLGKTLVAALGRLGIPTTGLDVVEREEKDGESIDDEGLGGREHIYVKGTVSDASVVRSAMGNCSAVLHTAALHAPHAFNHTDEEFWETNVRGAEVVLEEARRHGGISCVVVTSTTSLMISDRVRAAEADTASSSGGAECVFLDERCTGWGPVEPRNIYGRTKLAAESACAHSAALPGQAFPVAVLRTSRFFVEDGHPESTRAAATSDVEEAGLKAAELLGRRVSLTDVVVGHLLALVRASRPCAVYTLSAPSPFTRRDAALLKTSARTVLAERVPSAAAAFAKRGWTLPAAVTRVYEADAVMREVADGGLGWSPQLTFADLARSIETGEPCPLATSYGDF
jgi:nucleoside-diphosphate-sugar epimerase